MDKSYIDEEEASGEEMEEEEQCAEQPAEHGSAGHGQCTQQPAEEELNQRETPLGLDPKGTPSYIQHIATF